MSCLMGCTADIWSCTLKEDTEKLQELLLDGVSVDSPNGLGETPLLLAASRGLERVAKALLDAGANIHAKDWESGWTALHRSLYFGHIRLSLLLLEAGALLDGGRDQDQPAAAAEAAADRRDCCNRKPRSSSRTTRSESIGSSTNNTRATSSSRRTDGLGDRDGNTPLDILSLELRSKLQAAREVGQGGDVFSFGTADFTLGYDSFGKTNVVQPRRVEALANLKVVRVAASKFHSAAVTACGHLFTWGHGRSGRLGHGNEEVCMLPTRVEGLSSQKVTDVAASETHTAALTAEGELYTWGRDRFGQLGHGSGSSGSKISSERLAPKRVEALRKVTVVGVATGTEHTAAVSSAGTCYTWGRNNHGQLGMAGANQAASPRVVNYLVSGASRGSGGVGRHVIKNRYRLMLAVDPVIVLVALMFPSKNMLAKPRYQVSASARSTVVVTRGADRGSGLRAVTEVYQWGHGSDMPSRVNFNSNGDVSSSSKSSSKSPSRLSSRWRTHDDRVDITDVSAAKNHNLALSSVGQVYTWGFGADNLGLDPRETRTPRGPRLVAAMLPENCGGNAVHVSASDQHSCVVTDTGDLYTWGTADEEGGTLGHGDNRWQPVAKRVSSLKKVASVAAAPNHTMVLLQVSRPSLPHDASSASSTSRPSGEKVNADNVSDNEGDLDSEGDGDDDEEAARRSESPARTPGGILTRNSSGALEPLTLKQHCEIVLAREVDLRNAASLLAYADALDAPALVEFCAEFVSSNLDGILVMGRDSDRTCLLETSGALACSLLSTSGSRSTARTQRLCSAVALPAIHDGGDAGGVYEEEGLDREAMETALARAEMRAKTPSAKIAARAVRSLKKKIARIAELEGRRDSGEGLSADQMSKVEQKSRMEAELDSLGSQLERAKLAQSARAHRLQATGKTLEMEAHGQIKSAQEIDRGGRDRRDPSHELELEHGSSESVSKKSVHWAPQLDLSHDEPKVNDNLPIKCEVCQVKCANSNMYADHLKGKRHRATTAKLEQQLRNAMKASPPEPRGPRKWADVSVPAPAPTTTASATSSGASAQSSTVANSGGGDGGRMSSCLEPSRSQPRHIPNQLPRSGGGGFVSMRKTLEKEQKVATMFMGDMKKQDPAGAAVYGMKSLRPSVPANSNASGAVERSSAQESSSPAVYSLVDFISAAGSKKSSRRNEISEREVQGKAGRVWGVEDVNPAEEGGAEGSPSAVGADAVVDVSPGKKSFHEILEEEEREKKERDEYGDSVWFVSRKPRSTSFEGIVQQQKREERIAEEEREKEYDDEMLRLAMEMSIKEAQQQQSGKAASDGKGGRANRVRSSSAGGQGQTAGRGARRKKAENHKAENRKTESPLDQTKETRTPRKHGATAAKPKSEPRRSDPGIRRQASDTNAGGRRRRAKSHPDTRCGTAVNQPTTQCGEEVTLGTSVP